MARDLALAERPLSSAAGPTLLRQRTAIPIEKAAARPAAQRAVKVAIRNLSFFYGNSKALDDVSLTLYDKAVTALVGPSGCGKSTLLRAINRIYELYPDQRAVGEIFLDGENILAPSADVNLLRTRIGMVFQKPTPFPTSVYENIALALRRYGRHSKAEIDGRVEEALRRAALWDEVKDLLRHNALALSGGQQQRLCVARAIALRPEILLLDEPCSALDPLSTRKIEALIDELRRDYCIAIVTHNMGQAGRVSAFTAFMYLGKVVEFGTTYDIFTRPKDRHTEGFISGRFG